MAKFKKGDRVKIVELGFVHQVLGVRVGDVGFVEEDGSRHPYVTFDGNSQLIAVAESRLELLPVADAAGKTNADISREREIPGVKSNTSLAQSLIIQTGKFYRTRDGRKVGPMERYKDGWHVPLADGRMWRDDGLRYYEESRGGSDLIAEWVDEPASNDNQPVAEQQDGVVYIDVTKASPAQLHLAKGPLVRLKKGYYGYELARYGDYVWVEVGQKAPIVMRADEVTVAA